MSRFDGGRWKRILVWTGAALAWGTALISARVEERPQVDATNPSGGEVASVTSQAGMPVPPTQGLVILRFTPVETPQAEVITVEVARVRSPRPAASGPAVAAQPAPQPSSSGS